MILSFSLSMFLLCRFSFCDLAGSERIYKQRVMVSVSKRLVTSIRHCLPWAGVLKYWDTTRLISMYTNIDLHS